MDARRRHKQSYDKVHQDIEFKIGEEVLVYTKQRKVGLSEKLLCRYFGPYRVIKKTTPVTYLLEDVRTKSRISAHIDRIKKYYADEIEIDDQKLWGRPTTDIIQDNGKSS